MFNIINKSELIAKDIRFQISNKIYTHYLPSERKLADKYSVSRNTIREALEILKNKGIISLIANDYIINQPKEDLDWLEFFGKKTHHIIRNYIVKNEVFEANKKIAQKLEVPLATQIRLLVYKRTANEQQNNIILSIDYIYAPEKLAKNLPLKRLQECSFWNLLAKKYQGKKLKEYQSLSIESVNFEDANLLDVPVRSKILQRSSKVFIDNEIIYFVSKKIPSNSLLVSIDNNLKKEKEK
ncbi:GntR family transcriptional regulator [Lactobacillus sp. M0398]|uniref:GntR family transcriptional regulator n=1 Tax=unclassified Lactobacillus TaxID=2620435 RepID=UPI0018DC1100|nr:MULTISPECIES: GntR family transcriptional regulator [unclassified Lactobacillus]MBI0121996.1 GntR family transcriptional regulator [Lactobacillus sp. M0398]MBI0123872.1 GntR family transcriptional regulator [Lactobacillus sp. W8174]MBI0136040.1 GntR family transcriptional regulator [Lactobacillus sp. W8173]